MGASIQRKRRCAARVLCKIKKPPMVRAISARPLRLLSRARPQCPFPPVYEDTVTVKKALP